MNQFSRPLARSRGAYKHVLYEALWRRRMVLDHPFERENVLGLQVVERVRGSYALGDVSRMIRSTLSAVIAVTRGPAGRDRTPPLTGGDHKGSRYVTKLTLRNSSWCPTHPSAAA